MDTPSSTEEYTRHDGNISLAPASATPNPEHVPVANNAIGTKGQRRRASGVPGSRGVANLSAEQLAKKRANDREAQRAIRERTRNTIEGLERRIKELEGQQPFQELQRVVAERDRALAECEDLRRRLGAVAGIVGASSPQTGSGPGHPSLNELATYTAQQSPLPPRLQHPSQSPAPPFEQQHVHPDLRSPHSEGTPSYHRHTSIAHNLPSEQQRASPVQVQHANGGRLDVDFLLEQRPASTTPTARSFHSPRPLEPPIYARLPNVGPASCPLDSLLIDFVNRRRDLLREGVPVSEVIGPDYPDFDAMLNPNSSSLPQCHPVSAFFIDVLAKFPDVSLLPEKIAVFYIMFLVMRWSACPCQACYERLPEWCRPIQEQLDIPHVQYADYLPWPHMKRQLVLNEKEVNFGDFFVPYCATLSLNWPFPDDRVLLPAPSSHPADRRHLVMSPEFEEHLRNLDNWSLGNAFRNIFPHLIDLNTMRIRDP